MSNKIVVDRDTFSALASDTRIDILKELDERRKTLSELSRSLDTNKSAIYKHLNKLTEVGLIKKEDTGHKWKYYQLTWRGKHLLHPQKMKIRLLLSGAGAAAAAAIIAGYQFLQEKEAASAPGPGIMGTGSAEADPALLYLSIFFVILGALLIIASLLVWQKEEEYI